MGKKTRELKESLKRVTAFAPATVSNLAVGFDLLGLALEKPGDLITLSRREEPGLKITDIKSSADISYDPSKNTATLALSALLKDHGLEDLGFSLLIEKGIPMSSGLGGSAASAVGALVAFNGFLKNPLTNLELLPYAAYAEGQITGTTHLDNTAPCLCGGFVLCLDQKKILELPSPPLHLVVLHPEITIATKEARKLLPNSVSLKEMTQYSGRLGEFIRSLYEFNPKTFGASVQDDLIEPARASLWPHYNKLKETALELGALASCISGSGPTLLAWVEEEKLAHAIKTVLEQECLKMGYNNQCWVHKGKVKGAHVTSEES